MDLKRLFWCACTAALVSLVPMASVGAATSTTPATPFDSDTVFCTKVPASTTGVRNSGFGFTKSSAWTSRTSS
jgi:hypothetical protein